MSSASVRIKRSQKRVMRTDRSCQEQPATDSRNEAMNRLEQNAMSMGANAVLGMRFDSGELMQNTNEIVAYGTAVVLSSRA